MKKLNYFMNGFHFQYSIFKKHLSNCIDFDLQCPDAVHHTPGRKYIPLNILLLRKLYKNKQMNKYDIVQFNNTENFLTFKKLPHQIAIAESHGFDFGVNYYRFWIDEKNRLKKILGRLIDTSLGWKIRQKIKEFDLYYCSTPDMLESLKKVRSDVKRLPNPINIDIFKPEGPVIKLPGSPACFFPTRLHGDKKPEFAIDIFKNYIKPRFPEATLHLLNRGFEVPKYKKVLNDSETYYRHDFMDKETLAAKIRGSDFCFGDFSIGGLSLMPMQIMACKKPIVTYDMHELIKIEREGLQDLAKQLFEDEEFKQASIEKNYQYILDYHSEVAICRMHIENLRPLLISKLGFSEKQINLLLN